MKHLLLYLYGLIAFVEDPVAKEVKAVLLPDAQYPSTASLGCGIPAHVPAILFGVGKEKDGEYEYCTGDCRWLVPPDIGVVKGERLFGGWLLEGHELKLTSETMNSVFEPISATGALPKNPTAAASFDWAPRMSEAHGASAKLKTQCMEYDPADCPILARLLLDKAKARTCHLSQHEDGEVHAFRFRKLTTPDMPRGRQALTDVTEIKWMVDKDKPAVTLTATPFAFGNSRTATLTPNGEGVIEIHLINVPSLMYHPTRLKPCPHDEYPGIDTHFELYYQLLAGTHQVEDRRSAALVSSQRTEIQPYCDLKVPDDIFGMARPDYLHAGGFLPSVKIVTPRIPPACPPVVF